jgi:alpha-glucoside transport system substrate-binding protein
MWDRLGLRGMLVTAGAALVLIVLVGSCAVPRTEAVYPNLRGIHLQVVASWSGTEEARFSAVLRAFTGLTGASVAYASSGSRSMADVLNGRLAAGNPPDVALLPQPGLLRHYAESGRLVALEGQTAELVRRNYSAVWQSLGSVHGRLYGVWFKAANKSLLWYDIAAFERAGIAPPDDLNRLLAVMQALRMRGVTPFSVGGQDQWTLTDWFENLYLQLAGPHNYDQLAAHRLPWTDQSVKDTLRLMARLLGNPALLGGVHGTLSTSFEDSVVKAFKPPSGAAMVVEGDFVASFIAALPTIHIGTDVDAVPFPAAHPGVPLVVGGGDVAVQLRRSIGASALVRFLATPAAAAIWAAEGGYVSPNLELDLASYPDALTRSIARGLLEAGDSFRFDLSDLQPTAFGSSPGHGMQGALRDFLRTEDIPRTVRSLEDSARTAYGGAPK